MDHDPMDRAGEEICGPHPSRTATTDGQKLDTGKLRFLYLTPWDAMAEIVKVLEFGAKKYTRTEADGRVVKGEHNWKMVPGGYQRYLDAAARHLIAAQGGEDRDPESGLYHLGHAGCCILFALWFRLRGGGKA